MSATRGGPSNLRLFAAGFGLAAATCAAYAGLTWLRYGRLKRVSTPERLDAVLDRFLPDCEVAERHCTRVAASAEITFSAAVDMDLRQSAIVRAIFGARELILRGNPERTELPRPWLAQAKALGWGVLAEVPGRLMVFGAVTQPWIGDVVFRSLPAEDFVRF